MFKKTIFSICTTVLCVFSIVAQDSGRFSGAFNSNANIFIRDSLIGAANIPQYDNQKFGAEAWLDLGYSISGFDMGLRFDVFNNSNLRNPSSSFTDQGIGRWYISKKINKFGFTVGYIYDQIGAGTIFRSYEARPLFIDNALVGARVTYDFTDNWKIKAFTGRQKFIFDTHGPVLKGAAVEGYVKLSSKVSIAPGVGLVNRTLDDVGVERMVNIVRGYIDEDRIELKYNNYLGTFFNTMTAGKFAWYIEGSLKSKDAFNDPTAIQTEFDGATSFGKFISESGSLIYSSLSYATKGLGITVEGKRTENFNFRVDQTLTNFDGLTNFLPPMNRQNTYRLNARYTPATQDLSEQAFQLDVKYAVNKKLSTLVNVSNIQTLEGEQLYQELFTEIQYKQKRDWLVKTGIQFQEYNQEVYEVKPEVPNVTTVIPYVDFLYRFTRKKSLRTEFQYMFIGDDKDTKQDFGGWVFGQLEYSMAPHWTFTVSDMYNIDPGKNAPSDADTGEKLGLHYPRVDVFYTHHSNRFSLSYVKQVEGIVCTGGICRLEPAFSGFKLGISSTF